MKARINFTGELIISQTTNDDIKLEILEAIDTIILNFQEEYEEVIGYKEVVDINFDKNITKNKPIEITITWQGPINPSQIDELKRLEHHAKGLVLDVNIEHIHVETKVWE